MHTFDYFVNNIIENPYFKSHQHLLTKSQMGVNSMVIEHRFYL